MSGEVKGRTVSALFVAVIMILLSMYLKTVVERWEPSDWVGRTTKEYSMLVLNGVQALGTAIVLPWVLLKAATLQEIAESYVDYFIDVWEAITNIGDVVPKDIETNFGGRRRRR